MRALLTGHIDEAGFEALPDAVRRLWVDALVFDPANLALLIERFGAQRVLLGTDDPFVPGQLHEAQEMVRPGRRDDHRGHARGDPESPR
jgi:hypothetical protein